MGLLRAGIRRDHAPRARAVLGARLEGRAHRRARAPRALQEDARPGSRRPRPNLRRRRREPGRLVRDEGALHRARRRPEGRRARRDVFQLRLAPHLPYRRRRRPRRVRPPRADGAARRSRGALPRVVRRAARTRGCGPERALRVPVRRGLGGPLPRRRARDPGARADPRRGLGSPCIRRAGRAQARVLPGQGRVPRRASPPGGPCATRRLRAPEPHGSRPGRRRPLRRGRSLDRLQLHALVLPRGRRAPRRTRRFPQDAHAEKARGRALHGPRLQQARQDGALPRPPAPPRRLGRPVRRGAGRARHGHARLHTAVLRRRLQGHPRFLRAAEDGRAARTSSTSTGSSSGTRAPAGSPTSRSSSTCRSPSPASTPRSSGSSSRAPRKRWRCAGTRSSSGTSSRNGD